MAMFIVIALRMLVPVSIFRWPLAGTIASTLLDGADVILVDGLSLLFGESGGFGTHYHSLDKWLDLYFLSFAAVVSLRWDLLARNASIALFGYRLVGAVLFELTGIRKILFFFPNLFENFFFYYLAAKRFSPRLVARTVPQLLLALALLYIPKFWQEWLLHYQQAQPWNWFKEMFLGF